MFTGIIEEVGKIEKLSRNGDSIRLSIHADKVLEDVKQGDSIAVNGICLTVTSFTGALFTADVMHETLNRTALAKAKAGTLVNLERAMRAGDRFGGHIVAGHIDGTGTITGIRKDSNAVWFTISAEPKILRYIIEKGSIAIDGISLTVASVCKNNFSVSVIPHTLSHTVLSTKKVCDMVNLENDCIGKYVEKLLVPAAESGITREFLLKNGF